ncbi:hypothetical protein EG68_11188 [Paragonimus skrjabini miyazakii]|uniref:Uncharacterized protein n=1 Tax=Paragonimus skrjabini miyazakii TaxID=59628 RepID=A0A8S9YLM3_9TREM|nr:hypothetical protein EG68_11188 [Paragonimus skrjabini miyazakii]
METEEKVHPKYIKPYAYMEDVLCQACADGNMGLAARIMHERIGPNCRDAVGKTPLHYAALNGHFEIIRLLLCNRAIVDVADANNVTPLHLAARNDHLRCAQLLCMAGADITRVCASGCTARDLAPFDSPTCYFLERCELGEKPKPKVVFARPSKLTLPPHVIPRKTGVDNKGVKVKEDRRRRRN